MRRCAEQETEAATEAAKLCGVEDDGGTAPRAVRGIKRGLYGSWSTQLVGACGRKSKVGGSGIGGGTQQRVLLLRGQAGWPVLNTWPSHAEERLLVDGLDDGALRVHGALAVLQRGARGGDARGFCTVHASGAVHLPGATTHTTSQHTPFPIASHLLQHVQLRLQLQVERLPPVPRLDQRPHVVVERLALGACAREEGEALGTSGGRSGQAGRRHDLLSAAAQILHQLESQQGGHQATHSPRRCVRTKDMQSRMSSSVTALAMRMGLGSTAYSASCGARGGEEASQGIAGGTGGALGTREGSVVNGREEGRARRARQTEPPRHLEAAPVLQHVLPLVQVALLAVAAARAGVSRERAGRHMMDGGRGCAPAVGGGSGRRCNVGAQRSPPLFSSLSPHL